MLFFCKLRTVKPAEITGQPRYHPGKSFIGIIIRNTVSTFERDGYHRITAYVPFAELSVIHYPEPAEELLLPRGVAGILIVHPEEMAEGAQGQCLPEAPRAEQQEPASCAAEEGLQELCLVGVVDSLIAENSKILIPAFWCEPRLVLTCLCRTAFLADFVKYGKSLIHHFVRLRAAAHRSLHRSRGHGKLFRIQRLS